MEQLVSSGRIVDVVLAFLAIEALVLVGLNRVTGQGLSPAHVLTALAPGFFLLLAVRAALTGARWEAVAGALAASLVPHLLDLRQRWLRSSAPRPETRETGA